jgi:hypothetical protein
VRGLEKEVVVVLAVVVEVVLGIVVVTVVPPPLLPPPPPPPFDVAQTEVENVASEPYPVPAELVEYERKW